MNVAPRTVTRSQVSNLRMAAGNESRYTHVIVDGRLKNWVGIGWVDEGEATDEHRAAYPTVVED